MHSVLRVVECNLEFWVGFGCNKRLFFAYYFGKIDFRPAVPSIKFIDRCVIQTPLCKIVDKVLLPRTVSSKAEDVAVCVYAIVVVECKM